MKNKSTNKYKLDDSPSIESQENLSATILESMEASHQSYSRDRPYNNFLDLMNWSLNEFYIHLSDQENLQKFVHNRIIIDGPFLSFCKEMNVEVTCLHKDSIISWKNDNKEEKFFIQGVFLIKSKDVEFLHFAVWNKGNSYEDEISFFIIVSNKNYSDYIKLRNSFDEWIQKRDKNNLYIRVVDGEDLPYSKDVSWEDLFLPQEMKNEIKTLVENFLASKDFYLKNKIPWKRAMFFYGKPGNGKSSIIKTIIANYPFKPVTIAPGAGDEALREAFNYAEEQNPSLLFFEDLDSLLEKNVDASSLLNLMDGISARNGMLIVATANEIKKLKSNIIDRPQRFDRKFEIPLPNSEMAHIYLKRWFGDLLDTKKYKDLAKYAVKYEFSYAYLKELYISSIFEALAHNRKTPKEVDIEKSLSNLIKDKNILNKNVNIDRYFE